MKHSRTDVRFARCPPSLLLSLSGGCYKSCQAADVPIVKLNPLNILTVKAEGEKELREVSFHVSGGSVKSLLLNNTCMHLHRKGRRRQRAKRGYISFIEGSY